MAKNLHDGARVDALGDQQRRTPVAQVVEPQVRQSCARQQTLEATEDIARVEGFAHRRGEHQAAFLPLCSCKQSLLQLASPVCAQRLDGHLWQRNGPAATR